MRAAVVTRYGSPEVVAPGDREFAMTGTRMGGHAQRAVVKAVGVTARIAPGISFETAAALSDGGTTGSHF